MKTNIFADFPKLRGKINEKLGLNWWNRAESTIESYLQHRICVQKKSGQNVFPNITIESLNVFDVLNLCKNSGLCG